MSFRDDLTEYGNMFFREMVQFTITLSSRPGPTDSAKIIKRRKFQSKKRFTTLLVVDISFSLFGTSKTCEEQEF